MEWEWMLQSMKKTKSVTLNFTDSAVIQIFYFSFYSTSKMKSIPKISIE